MNNVDWGQVAAREGSMNKTRGMLEHAVLFAKSHDSLSMDWLVTEKGDIQAYYYQGDKSQLHKVLITRLRNGYIIGFYIMDGDTPSSKSQNSVTVPVEGDHIVFVLRRAEYLVIVKDGIF